MHLMHKVRVFSILAVLVLAGADLQEVQAQTNMIIYSNALQNGWANWSWNSTLNFASTSPVRSGDSHSISVGSTNYGALYLNVSGTTEIDSTQFTNVTFWLNGGSAGGQSLTMAATLSSTPSGSTVVVGPLAANTWQQYTVSLESLGVANELDLDGFWFQINTGGTLPTYYLADMELVAGPPPGPNPTNFIGIDVSANRTPISQQIYGTAAATSNQIADLNFTMNRSGGNEETTYNWEINTHGKGADYYFESYPDSSATPGETADSFVANSKVGGAQPLITVPMIGWAPVLGPGRSILYSYAVTKYGPQTSVDPYLTNAGN
ncbi:MAG TPA: glycoside hydrolase family 44 protein, partial [Verrucomicrobiae bacterium]|nr:glycoside hydrolase family 44 protein [Verrucomicrobiae bacterium]